ncbi:origin recognition complex subunit 3 N-terminus-domain-containing protein [Protomyces lactucae-debilis]|uniref:Origin recognition complex subunit 3 N-terminus-domain-containing protein n=1 Tax=Protomyces lactucae-debilis TaxID=2754530 RepID=A0A1Y2FXE9_PROLT|nr:origin recognition complex subunit 3 N-terminus-domain-containing protein [Protomyces lactucae-debilis]ORY87964.1 origin recognition complex subunit 3 N-terminus-domain-containing protein [Protomyces lactucae-debilis]
MSQQSIVDSCFFSRPDDKSKRKRRSRSAFEGSPRYAAFEQCLAQLNGCVETHLKEENLALVARLLQFIQAPHHTAWPTRQIKCAVLQAGSNMSNLARAFVQLEERVFASKKQPCALTVLNASDCTQLRLTMKKLVSSTLAQGKTVTNDTGVQSHDIRLLKVWHEAQREPLPIVVAIPNLEGFAPGLVTELIQHFSTEEDLDIRFMLGVPTSFGQYQTAISTASIRLLDVERVSLDSDQQAVEKIIFTHLIESDNTLRLGFDAYQVLRSHFQHSTRSLEQFVAGLRYQLLCFFYSNELAHLVREPQHLVEMSAEDRRLVCQLPSFREHIKALVGSKKLPSLHRAEALLSNDDEALRKLCLDAVDSIASYKANLHVVFRVWDILRSLTSAQRFSFPDSYGVLLERGLATSSITKESLISLKKFPTEKTEAFLRACLAKLGECAIAQQLALYSAALAESVSSEQKVTIEIHDYLKELFETHLISHEHLLLHELFWTNSTRSYDAAYTAATRQSLAAALKTPSLYLGEMSVDPYAPALFKLFQDSGQLVNVYDWFQAYGQVCGEQGGDEEAEKLQQALFARGTAELQFLGFFKSTKRKTDHVQKTFSTL